MKYTKLSLYLLVVHFTFFLHAGENDTIVLKSTHLILFNTGFSNYVSKDEAISPFIYRGYASPFEISYLYLRPKTVHTFCFYYNSAKLTPEIPEFPEQGLNHYKKSLTLDINYSCQRKIKSLMPFKTTLFIGGEFNVFLNVREHFFFYNQNHIMLDQFNSLSFRGSLERKFKNNKHTLQVSVCVPVFSYVLMGGTYNALVGEKSDRLDLGKNVFWQILKNGDFVTLNKLFDFRTELAYAMLLSYHFGLNFKYSFHYYKYTQYDDLLYSRNLSNQLLVGLFIKI